MYVGHIWGGILISHVIVEVEIAVGHTYTVSEWLSGVNAESMGSRISEGVPTYM